MYSEFQSFRVDLVDVEPCGDTFDAEFAVEWGLNFLGNAI
jgi:hypothetical protein